MRYAICELSIYPTQFHLTNSTLMCNDKQTAMCAKVAACAQAAITLTLEHTIQIKRFQSH